MDVPLAFKIEWFDELAAMNKVFILTYFPDGPAVQINHTKQSSKNGGWFLKKLQYNDLLLEDLFIGNKVEILSRRYTIVDFGDDKTRNIFQPSQSKAFMLIKPESYSHIGKIINSILSEGLQISKLKMAYLDKTLAQYFAQQSWGGDTKTFKSSMQSLMEDVSVGIEIEGEDAVGMVSTLWGPHNPSRAKEIAPNSFSAKFGKDLARNAVYCTPDEEDKDRVKFFGSTKYTWVLENCTLWVIKPHCLQDGTAGLIIDFIINQGFEISALGIFNLKQSEAEEFFDFR
jgi:nucleoside-diphosphate kinase